MLGRLTIYPRVATFLQCIHAKNYENWLAFDKVIAKISRLTLFGPPCIIKLLGNGLSLKSIAHVSPQLSRIRGSCNLRPTSRCNGISETTWHNRHNGLLPAPTCYRLAADLLRGSWQLVADLLQGNWCNGFWPLSA